MYNEERIAKLKESKYQEIFGVKKFTFDKMLEILENQYKKEHLKGGRPPKLSVLDKLVIMLSYYKEYRTMQNMAFDYNVSKSTICESIQWVENTLMKSGNFKLPSKKDLENNISIEVVLVDVTECEIQRPQKNKNSTTLEKRKSIQ